MDGTEQIDLNCGPPGIDFSLVEGPDGTNLRGIVDQHIHGPVFALDPSDGGFDCSAIYYIEWHGVRPTAALEDERGGIVQIGGRPRQTDHRHSRIGECARDCTADTTTRPGNDRYPRMKLF